MQQETNGINEEKLGELIEDIFNSADKINEILVKISELINNTSNYFICDNANMFREKFDEIKKNFPTVNSNILEYANDLVKVKNNYNNRRTTIINQTDINTSDKLIDIERGW